MPAIRLYGYAVHRVYVPAGYFRHDYVRVRIIVVVVVVVVVVVIVVAVVAACSNIRRSFCVYARKSIPKSAVVAGLVCV